MEVIKGGLEELPATKLCHMDQKGNGGAYHKYAVMDQTGKKLLAGIDFQNGGVKDVGVNGCHNEDLLAIVIDRLSCFQEGEFACEENAKALAHCGKALSVLEERTAARVKRGVEGQAKV